MISLVRLIITRACFDKLHKWHKWRKWERTLTQVCFEGIKTYKRVQLDNEYITFFVQLGTYITNG